MKILFRFLSAAFLLTYKIIFIFVGGLIMYILILLWHFPFINKIKFAMLCLSTDLKLFWNIFYTSRNLTFGFYYKTFFDFVLEKNKIIDYDFMKE